MTSFPTVDPIEEIKVTASEVAMVIRVGILSTTSMTGTKIKAPPAPNTPATAPISSDKIEANPLLN